jgi:HEAT repeat protein
MTILGKLGPDGSKGVPKLCKLLQDPDEATKKAAITALGRIGPKAEDAVPTLVVMLGNAVWHDQASAAIVKIGAGSVDTLLEALDNTKDFKSRVELIGLLGAIGPDAEDAIKPLQAIVDGGDLPGVRRAAVRALSRIGKRKK